MDFRYVVVTPARNEEAHIEKTIESMARQTIRPVEWVIVDDGSTDSTADIIKRHLQKHSWMRLLQRKDRGFRKAAGGDMESFYDGLESLETKDWDFIVKIDGDLSFEDRYFERCLERFRADSRLGVGGGTVYHNIGGRLKPEITTRFHVRGATKIYRRSCWDAIGGLLKPPGWDTLDEVKANMLGWKSESFPDIMIVHHRYTGTADGLWRNGVKNGLANYISGYHPLFMLLKCVKRFVRRPYSIEPFALMYGFLGGYARKVSQVNDRTLIAYLRKQQINRLFLKESIWK